MLTKSEIKEMSVSERALLAEALWDSIANEEVTEIPEWQKEILEGRLKYSLEHPEEAIPLELFIAQLEDRRRNVQRQH